MEFRTPISIHPSPYKIGLKTPFLSIGSCFSHCIGEKLASNKFPVLSNPFGTVFNPISISKLLQYSATGSFPPEHTYIENEGIWRNLDFHSDFSALDRRVLEQRINSALEKVAQWLPKVKHLLITPGTAWVYQTKQENHLVANCHKLPSAQFHPKRLLDIDEIVAGFEQLMAGLKTINPDLQYIFTVSPVRHVKDTLELNAISKATLLLAVKQLRDKYENVDYFPSYEIMIDDLRDYRFYEADMIHPNSVAENYIWDKFSFKYFEPDTLSFLKKWQKIRQAMAHRPFQEHSAAYKVFLQKTIEQVEAFKDLIDIREELLELKAKLNTKR